METYWVAEDGFGYGPFSYDQISQFIDVGIVEEDQLIWREGDYCSLHASTLLEEQSSVSVLDDDSESSSSTSIIVLWGLALLIWSAALLIFVYSISGEIMNVRIASFDVKNNVGPPTHNDGSFKDAGDVKVSDKEPNPETEMKTKPEKANSQKTILPKPIFSLTFDDDVLSVNRITESGARLVDGKIGKAIEFDGSNFIEIPCTLPSGNSPRTLTAWIQNSEDSGTMNSHSIACGSDVEEKRVWGIYHANGNWSTYGWGRYLEANTHVDREWHYHCISFDGENVVYYLDGKNVGEKKAKLNSTAGPMVLGTYANRAMGFSFKGIVDEVKVYDVALDKQQVEEIYESYRQK